MIASLEARKTKPDKFKFYILENPFRKISDYLVILKLKS